MQELIKIKTTVIGANETNAVSARELYETLEIKQQFGNWINKQIDRAGLRENVDYIIVTQKVEAGKGVSTRKEYIITTDASKHIAMMSQGAKAKEVRDYFIAVEKEYKTIQSSENVSFHDLVPVLQNMVEMMSLILKNQEKLYSDSKAKQDNLSPQELGKIRGAVNLAALPIMEFFDEDIARVQKAIYTKLNNRLGVPSYIYIPSVAFSEAIEIINELERKYILKLEDRKKMSIEISGNTNIEKF